jgi:hypothetical protein
VKRKQEAHSPRRSFRFEFDTDLRFGAGPALRVGDAFLNPIFTEHPDWLVTGDTSPNRSVESRRALIERACNSNTHAFAESMLVRS